MNFLRNLLPRNKPYDLAYSNDYNFPVLKLFIDQRGNKNVPSNKRVEGIMLVFRQGQISLFLEPTHYINALLFVMQQHGINGEIRPYVARDGSYDNAPASRVKRMVDRGRRDEALLMKEMSNLEDRVHYGAGLIYVHTPDGISAMLASLEKHGFISTPVVTVLQEAIKLLEFPNKETRNAIQEMLDRNLPLIPRQQQSEINR